MEYIAFISCSNEITELEMLVLYGSKRKQITI
jgi:hypothetical protein